MRCFTLENAHFLRYIARASIYARHSSRERPSHRRWTLDRASLT